ncbi:MAG: tetratricopeptide repeat protein [Phycisphaerales bacterium]
MKRSIPVIPSTCVLFLLASSTGFGCVRRENLTHETQQPARDRAAHLTLDERARLEADTAVAQQFPIPAPPGVEPSRIQLREPDERASMSIAEVIASHAAETDAAEIPRAAQVDVPRTEKAQPLAFAERVTAQHHYVAGQQAAFEGRQYQANLEFRRACEIDPTSPVIVRNLARSYAALGDITNATTIYTRLLDLVPGDSEATLSLGLTAARQSEFEEVIHILGPARDHLDHDPAATLLAYDALLLAFRELGYERAEIEAATTLAERLQKPLPTTRYRNELAAYRRQLPALWMGIGDALLRIGDLKDARDSYARAAAAGGVGQVDLLARRMYAALRLGRPLEAQQHFRDAVRRAHAEAHEIERLLDLAAYLREQTESVDTLIDELQGSGAPDARSPHTVQLIASLLPGEKAIAMLRDAVQQRPRDIGMFRTLVMRIHSDQPRQLAAIITGLLDAQAQGDQLELLNQYADVMWDVCGFDADLLDDLRAQDRSLITAALETRGFLKAGGAGSAWQLNQGAVKEFGAVEPFIINGFEIAAMIGDRALLQHPPLHVTLDNPRSLAASSRARAQLGDQAGAVADATRLTELTPHDPAAWVHLARARLTAPASARGAVLAAERALELEPEHTDAYGLLMQLYQPGGLEPDAQNLQTTWNRLSAAAPASSLRKIVFADQLLAQQRYPTAIDMLKQLYAQDHSDESSYADVVRRLAAAFIASSEWEAGAAWFAEARAARPNDPVLLRNHAEVLLAAGRTHELESILAARLTRCPQDPVAGMVMEMVDRSAGRSALAMQRAIARLAQYPACTSRSIERAALFAGVGERDEALREVVPLFEDFAGLDQNQAMRLVDVLSRLPEDDLSSSRARLTLYRQYIERWPDAPLRIYADALVAAARMNAPRDEVEKLTQQLLRRAPADTAEDQNGTLALRDAAERLARAQQPRVAGELLRERLEATNAQTNPQSVTLLAQAAQACFAAAGDIEAARALLDELQARDLLKLLPITQGPNVRSDADYSLSVFCTLLGRDDDAALLLRKTLEAQPDHAMAMNNLGYHLTETSSDGTEAEALLTRAHTLEPDDANIIDSLAWLRYRQGKFSQTDPDDEPQRSLCARELLEPIVANIEDEPGVEVFNHFGDIMYRLGDIDAARTAWKKAISIIDDSTYRSRTIEGYLRFQRGGWGILIIAPEQVFARLHDDIKQCAQQKLAAIENGTKVPVVPTFEEAQAALTNDPHMTERVGFHDAAHDATQGDE